MELVEKDPHQQSLTEFYAELKDIAEHLLRGERANHTLQRTALANETFMRLVGKRSIDELNLHSLLPLAAHQMRQVLVDYGRKRLAKKRGESGARRSFPSFARSTESSHSLTASYIARMRYAW